MIHDGDVTYSRAGGLGSAIFMIECDTAVSVKRAEAALGAFVTGVDLSAEVDERVFQLIKKTLDERSVVVVKDQRIRPQHLTRFASRFGELLVHVHSKNVLPDHPAVSVLSNVVENGKNIGVPDAGMVWHTDGSYLNKPDMYTFLYGIEIPAKDGKPLGNTLYASTAAAYDGLSEAMKRKLAPLKAVHSLVHHSINRARAGGTRIEITDELRKKAPDREQPVIRTHPVTGRKCIYVSEGHTTHIVGMDPTESANLLQELFDHMRRPEFVYSHAWEVGDLVVWDNAATQHRATADYALPLRRLMNRVATEGTAPF